MSVALFRGLKIRIRRLYYGLDTPKEILYDYIDRMAYHFLGKTTSLYVDEHSRRVLKPDAESYHVKDIKLPLLDDDMDKRSLSTSIYEDTLWSYAHCGDQYDEDTFERCDKFLSEGLYGLVNDKVNVTVKPGDIVIDAGSWAGDFAAYASVKGASVYAFEPTDHYFGCLSETARLNGNIIPVKKGLSNENTTMNIFNNFSGSSYTKENAPANAKADSSETIRLDNFVRENNLSRVDFIKSDIEGFERYMLEGAQETLARFAPKLALCTYHLPDDPQVMAELILKANPKYNIVQKRMKLFASV